MIKRVNLLVLQAVADKLPPRTKEIVEDAIHEIAEWRSAMRRINDEVHSIRHVYGQPTGIWNAIEHPEKPLRRVR